MDNHQPEVMKSGEKTELLIWKDRPQLSILALWDGCIFL
jgi:hypothetical protein